MQDKHNNHINIDEKIKEILSGTSFGPMDKKMHDYIAAQLTSQAIERAVLDIVKVLGEDKFTAFIEFIKKGASRNSLYIYLSSLYPNTENIIIDKVHEVVAEFKQEFKKD
jgi:hypothetical protein